MPGMRILQFGFGNPGAHIYLPHKLESNTVVYTGTHDNDTTVGWWQRGATDDECRYVRAYLGPENGGIHWEFICCAQVCVDVLRIVSMRVAVGYGRAACT